MKKSTVLFILFSVLPVLPARAFDPMSVYAQKAPEGCLSSSVGKEKLSLNDLIQIGICNNPD